MSRRIGSVLIGIGLTITIAVGSPSVSQAESASDNCVILITEGSISKGKLPNQVAKDAAFKCSRGRRGGCDVVKKMVHERYGHVWSSLLDCSKGISDEEAEAHYRESERRRIRESERRRIEAPLTPAERAQEGCDLVAAVATLNNKKSHLRKKGPDQEVKDAGLECSRGDRARCLETKSEAEYRAGPAWGDVLDCKGP